MAKTIKYLSIITGIILLLVIAVIAAIPLFFDPNEFKPEISAAVKEATGRELNIEGEIELSLFPWLGMKLGKVELSNAAGFGSQPFAGINSAEVKIKLFALLKQEVEMRAVTLHGLNVNLQIAADGSSNWDDLSQPTTKSEPTTDAPTSDTISPAPLAALAIGGLNISNANISYNDKSTNSHYRIEQFNLNTGPVSLTTPLDIKLNTKLHSDQPKMDGHIDLATRVTFDLDAEQYTLEGLILKIDAASRDLPGGNAALLLKANIETDLKNQTASINDLEISSRGLNLSGAFDFQQILTAAPTFAGQLSLAELNPKTLLHTLEIEAPITADSAALTKASLNFSVDGSAENLSIKSLTLLLDDSHITGDANINFSPNSAMPAIRYTLNLDSIDADRYLPPVADDETITPATPATAGAAAVSLPMDTLRGLNIDGQTTIGKLKISGLNISEIRTDIKAKDGLIRLHPLSAKLYQGEYQGDTQLDVRGDIPKISLNESLQGIETGPLLIDFMDDDLVSGNGSFQAKLTATGITPEEITRTLNGSGKLSFINGSVKGFNLAQLIREAQARINKQPKPEKIFNQTDFAAFSSSFEIKNGVVSNTDLLIKSPYVRIGGKGKVDLNNESIDYRVNAKIVKTEQGQGGAELASLRGLDLPVHIGGTFTEPTFRLELDKVLKAEAKKALDKEKARIKAELESKLETEKAAARKKIEEEQARLKQEAAQKKEELEQQAKDKLKDKLKDLLR